MCGSSRDEFNGSRTMIAFMQKLKAAETLATLEHLEGKPHLSPGELHKRDTCLAKLIHIGAPAVPLLVRKLAGITDSNPTAFVPMILQQMGDVAVPGLARAMHSGDCHIRHNAISLLGRIATPAAVSALDDDSVDLMDMEVLQQARHKAHQQAESGGEAKVGSAAAEDAWFPGNDSWI